MKDSIKEYGEFFQKLSLTELSIEDGDIKIFMKRDIEPKNVTTVAASPVAPIAETKEVSTKNVDLDVEEVKAPLLGTFYANKDSRKVNVGDSVKKGDVLCNIEAMKMFNEVVSSVDGIVSEICTKDGDLVEYNQTLFLIKKVS